MWFGAWYLTFVENSNLFFFINVEFSALVPTLSIVRWSFTSDLLVKRLIDKIFIVENKIILWWFMGGSKET